MTVVRLHACLRGVELLDPSGDGNEEKVAEEGKNKYRQMFSLRVLHYLAFFILIYVGIELTMGGSFCLRLFSALCFVLTATVQAGLSRLFSESAMVDRHPASMSMKRSFRAL